MPSKVSAQQQVSVKTCSHLQSSLLYHQGTNTATFLKRIFEKERIYKRKQEGRKGRREGTQRKRSESTSGTVQAADETNATSSELLSPAALFWARGQCLGGGGGAGALSLFLPQDCPDEDVLSEAQWSSLLPHGLHSLNRAFSLQRPLRVAKSTPNHPFLWQRWKVPTERYSCSPGRGKELSSDVCVTHCFSNASRSWRRGPALGPGGTGLKPGQGEIHPKSIASVKR